MRIGEVPALLVLQVAHRPFVQEGPQARAGRERHPLDEVFEPRRQAIGEPPRADDRVVAHHPQAARIGVAGVALEERGGARHVAVGAESADVELVAEEGGAELVIRFGGSEADAHYTFHGREPVLGARDAG